MERGPERPWSAYQPSRPFSYHPSSSNGFHDSRPPSRMSSQGRLSAPGTPRDSRYTQQHTSSANQSRFHSASANQRRASSASRKRKGKCVCGLLLTLTSLLMYFAGGFLLVAHRQAVYPVLEQPVEVSLIRYTVC